MNLVTSNMKLLYVICAFSSLITAMHRPAPRPYICLTNHQRAHLVSLHFESHLHAQLSNAQIQEKIAAIREIPSFRDSQQDPYFLNVALLGLARKSTQHGNIGNELAIAKVLLEKGADVHFEEKVPEADFEDSTAPQRYSKDVVWKLAKGDLKELIEPFITDVDYHARKEYEKYYLRAKA